MRCVTFVLPLLVAGGCAGVSNGDPADEYFRPGTFDIDRDYEFWRPACTRYLRAMGEPSLLPSGDTDQLAFRLLWIPSFSPVMVVRIARRGELVVSRAVVLNDEDPAFEWDDSWDMPAPKPASVIENELTLDAWSEIERLAAVADVWRIPTDIDEFGFDGWEWFLEMRDGDHHHVVRRWSQTQRGRAATNERRGRLHERLCRES